jgi:hypothetical protein
MYIATRYSVISLTQLPTSLTERDFQAVDLHQEVELRFQIKLVML